MKNKLPPIKKYFDVVITTMLPATLHYHILAETAQEAAELSKHKSPNSVKHKLIGRKDLKLMVYDSGSTLIKFIKNIIK